MAQTADPDMPNTPQPTPAGYGMWMAFLLAALAGLAMFCAFPPLDFGGLAWFAAALFFFAITQCPTPSTGAAAGAIYGVAFFGPLLWYISAFGFVPWALVVILEAAFAAAMGYLAAWLNRLRRPGWRVVGLAALWVIIEYLRAHRGPVSLSLGSAYYTQWDELPLLQLASVGGSLLISFYIALLGSAIATTAVMWLPGRWLRPDGWGPRMARDAARALLFAYAAFFAAFFWGSWTYRTGAKATTSVPETAAFRVAYVQAASRSKHMVTQAEAESATEAYFELTEMVPAGADLIIWPETAMPLVLDDRPDLKERLAKLAREKGSFLLVGTNERAPAGRLYNSMVLLTPDGKIIDRYRKVHLVLFGEYVPGRDRFKFLERFPIRPYDYAPGDGFNVLRANRMHFGVLICFEALFPEYVRRLCRDGAEFVVVATSDAWAAGTYEVAQHSRTAIFRAVEARRYVVRAATHGQSMVITPFGDRLGVIDIGERGIEHQLVVPLRRLSFYHRWGDWPLLGFCLLMWLGACVNILTRKGEHNGPSTDSNPMQHCRLR